MHDMPSENLSEQLYDIYGVWHIPFWQRSWFVWGVGITVIVILLTLVWLIVRAYRTKKEKEQVSYWDYTLHELTQLKKQGVVTSEQGKLFYVRLTGLLKKYIQSRYRYDLTGKTDTEVIVYLQQIGFDPPLLAELKTIFEGGVIIKFAPVQAIRQQIESDWGQSIAFVQKTMPSESPDSKG